MANCIFQGADERPCSENITTSMKVKSARGETDESICSVHEDDASPKKVRELVEAREQKVEAIMKQAEAMGLKLVPTNTVVVPPQVVTPPLAAPLTRQATAKSDVDRPKKVNTRPVNAPTDSQFAEKHDSYDLATEEAPALIKAEGQTIVGRDGVPIDIPKRIVNEAGVTDITITTAVDDRQIQNRFKNIADGDFKFKQQNYGLRDCTFCRGTGKSKIGDQTCPRCKGIGQM